MEDQRIKAIAVMAALFDKFTEEKVVLYNRMLSDIPPVLVDKAIQSLARTSKFPPTVAEIREKAEEIYRIAGNEPIPDAGEAWGEVLQAISHQGSYRTPKFDDPITTETVRRMGWQELCRRRVEMSSVDRAQFMKMYDDIARRQKSEKQIRKSLQDGKVQKLLLWIAQRKALSGGKR